MVQFVKFAGGIWVVGVLLRLDAVSKSVII